MMSKELIIVNDDEEEEYPKKIYIAKDGRHRFIGKLIKKKGKRIYFKQEKEKDIFHKTNSWTINTKILEHLNDEDYIVYKTELHYYQIRLGTALKVGIFRVFDFEEKLHVPLDYWNIKKI